MSYWSLYYHCVWATQNREPLLTATIRPQVYAMIAERYASSTGRPCYMAARTTTFTCFVRFDRARRLVTL